MGYIQEPPPKWEVAQAHDDAITALEPRQQHDIKMISYNIKREGSISQQEAFKLTWSEIRGVMERARAKGSEALKGAAVEIRRLVDDRILNNPGYNKFKVQVVEGDDPLLR
jgi:hypothetical protein